MDAFREFLFGKSSVLELNEKGLSAFDEERYDDAVRFFERAMEQSSTANVKLMHNLILTRPKWTSLQRWKLRDG